MKFTKMVYYNSFGNVFGTHVEKVGNQRSVDIRQKDRNEDKETCSKCPSAGEFGSHKG